MRFGRQTVAARNATSKFLDSSPKVLKNPCIVRKARYVVMWNVQKAPPLRERWDMKYTIIM